MSLNTKIRKLCLQCQACCKLIYIPTSRPNRENLKFYTARGIRFINNNGVFCAAVPSVCPQLTPQGCKMGDNRPEDCKAYDGRKDPLLKSVCLWDTKNQGVLKRGTPRVKGGLR